MSTPLYWLISHMLPSSFYPLQCQAFIFSGQDSEPEQNVVVRKEREQKYLQRRKEAQDMKPTPATHLTLEVMLFL